MEQALEGLYHRSLTSALAAFALTLGVIMMLAPVARRVGWVDRPGGRKTHASPTPVIGGLAMLIGSLPLAIATFELTRNVVGLMVGGAIVIAAGVWDDFKQLNWRWRLAGQVAAALAMVYIGGVRVEMIGPLFGREVESLGYLSVPFTVLATVGVMNALNMADGVDGLAGGLAAAALAMIACAAVYAGNDRLSHGLVLMLGALTAFLVFNMRTPWTPRAHIFLGNAGSEFLGLVIAWCCFRLTQNVEHPVTPALAPFFLAPPIIDCLVLMVRRMRNKRSPFMADRNHLHHILLDANWSTTAAVGLIVAISLAMGLCAALSLRVQTQPIVLVAVFTALTLLYYALSAKRGKCVVALRAFGRALGLVKASQAGSEQRDDSAPAIALAAQDAMTMASDACANVEPPAGGFANGRGLGSALPITATARNHQAASQREHHSHG